MKGLIVLRGLEEIKGLAALKFSYSLGLEFWALGFWGRRVEGFGFGVKRTPKWCPVCTPFTVVGYHHPYVHAKVYLQTPQATG